MGALREFGGWVPVARQIVSIFGGFGAAWHSAAMAELRWEGSHSTLLDVESQPKISVLLITLVGSSTD